MPFCFEIPAIRSLSCRSWAVNTGLNMQFSGESVLGKINHCRSDCGNKLESIFLFHFSNLALTRPHVKHLTAHKRDCTPCDFTGGTTPGGQDAAEGKLQLGPALLHLCRGEHAVRRVQCLGAEWELRAPCNMQSGRALNYLAALA